jgi:uncharacterized protein (DUF1330 family)
MTGAINPLREQFDAFKGLPREAPIHMLNLIRLRARAAYDVEHPNAGKTLSGLDAYRLYGRDSAALFQRLGGRQIWAGKPECMVIGPADERWDIAFIAAYPSANAFLAMLADPQYKEAVKHRTAAVDDSRLIRLAPINPGEGFGE